MSEQTAATQTSPDTPPEQKRKCVICKEAEATVRVRFGVTPEGKPRMLSFCDEHAPELEQPTVVQEKPRKRKTKNRLAATDYATTISAFLYRLGGCTLEQAAHWLMLYLPGQFPTESAALEAARRTLQVMREQRQVEVISIRRLWSGKRTGRRENFYRLSTARSGAAIVEGAIAAEEDPAKALGAYRRVWKSGGIDHAAHRSDLYLLLADDVEGREDINVDPERMISETHRDFPYYGAKAELRDNGGEKITLKKNARRKYEEVTPDGEWWGEFSFGVGDRVQTIECPYLLELERRTNAGKVEEKIQKIAGYWHRWIDFKELDLRENKIRPVVIVHHDTREARVRGRREGGGAYGLRAAIYDRLFYTGSDGRIYRHQRGHFAKLDELLVERFGMPFGSLGNFFIFAAWEGLYAHGPFSLQYLPVYEYITEGTFAHHVSEDGWTCDLAAAALMHEALVRAVEANPKGIS